MSSVKRRWIHVFVSLAIVFLYCGALVPVSAWAIGEPGIDAGMETSIFGSSTDGDFADAVILGDGYGVVPAKVEPGKFTIKSVPSDISVSIGDEVSFIVELSGTATSGAVCTWFVNGEVVEVYNVEGLVTSFSLTFSADSKHFGVWSCKVEYGTKGVVESESWMLTETVIQDTDPSPTPTPDPDQTPDAEPTPTPEITPAPAVDATIWDKPFDEYTPTEGLLLILVVLVLTAGTVKLFGRFW